jgi:hypothetical protein
MPGVPDIANDAEVDTLNKQAKDILIALSDVEFLDIVLWVGQKHLVLRLNASFDV